MAPLNPLAISVTKHSGGISTSSKCIVSTPSWASVIFEIWENDTDLTCRNVANVSLERSGRDFLTLSVDNRRAFLQEATMIEDRGHLVKFSASISSKELGND